MESVGNQTARHLSRLRSTAPRVRSFVADRNIATLLPMHRVMFQCLSRPLCPVGPNLPATSPTSSAMNGRVDLQRSPDSGLRHHGHVYPRAEQRLLVDRAGQSRTAVSVRRSPGAVPPVVRPGGTKLDRNLKKRTADERSAAMRANTNGLADIPLVNEAAAHSFADPRLAHVAPPCGLDESLVFRKKNNPKSDGICCQ